MTVDEFPCALFVPEGARNPKGERVDVVSSADSCFPELDLKDGRKFRGLIFCDGVEARYIAIPESR